MKRFAQVVSLILIFSLVLAIPAFAAEAAPRASNYFGSHSVYLNRVSSTKLEVCFSVTAVGGMDELGASTIIVQRSSDGTNWEDMKTYTKDAYTNMIAKDTGFHSSSVSYTCTSGYSYRAYIQFYAKKGTGTAYYSDYSDPV